MQQTRQLLTIQRRFQTIKTTKYRNMKHTLKPGLHVALVTNTKPGSGGSLMAFETYIACRLAGIPAILATYDPRRMYPKIGSDLRRLKNLESLSEHPMIPRTPYNLESLMAEAAVEGKFLIVDTEPGLEGEASLRDAISCIEKSATSVTALVPAPHGIAPDLEMMNEIGSAFETILVRYWGFSSPDVTCRTSRFRRHYHWRPGFLTFDELELILDLTVEEILETTKLERHLEHQGTPLNKLGEYLRNARHCIVENCLAGVLCSETGS